MTGPKTTFALVALLVAAGCSIGRTTRTETTTEGGFSTGASLSLHDDPAEAALERARDLARNGRYEEAAESFRRLYEDRDAKEEHRAAALFGLGETYSNVLNPDRDPARAREAFRRVVDEFPESDRKREAETRLQRLGDEDSS